jgi:hypothetical protein
MSEATVLASVAVGLVLGAAVVWYRGWRLFTHATSANAEVVAVRAYGENRTTRYAQICRFELEGQKIEAELKAELPYQVGAQLQVFFERGHPDRIRVKSQVYRPVLILLVFAGLAAAGWFAATRIG